MNSDKITLTSEKWFKGQRREYSYGDHSFNRTPFQDTDFSCNIPEGFKVTFFRDYFKGGSIVIYQGKIQTAGDITRWAGWTDKNTISSMRVEKTENKDFITIYEHNILDPRVRKSWEGRSLRKLPIGEAKYDEDFRNDTISAIVIPEGLVVEAWDNIDDKPESRVKLRRGTHFLGDYGLNDRVSRLQVSKEGFKLIKTDFGEPVFGNKKIFTAGRDVVENPTDDEQEGVSGTFTKQVDTTTETTFEAGFSFSATTTVGYEGGTEFSKVKVEQSFTVGTEVKKGENKSVTNTASESKTYSLKSYPLKRNIAVYKITQSSITIPFVATMEDEFGKRTKVQGEIKSDNSLTGEVFYSDEPMLEVNKDEVKS